MGLNLYLCYQAMTPANKTLEVVTMTAYELFKKAYYHYMGNFMGHLVDGQTNPKDYIQQTFNEDLNEYVVECADSNCIMLSCGDVEANPADKERLQDIEIFSGYWLCHHDGHTGDWMFWHYNSKIEAKTAYKELYSRYLRHQNWCWTIKTK
jgi:hypothetical protein